MEIMQAFWHGFLARRKLFKREKGGDGRGKAHSWKEREGGNDCRGGKLSVKDPGVKF